MAKVHIHSGQGAVGTGDLQLQNGAPMDATLRPVTDAANTASPLELSTGLVAVTSTLQIATNDTEYIDAEDGSGNNRFTVSRASGSQVVNVDYASNPTSATDQVGAIRTYANGASLSDAVSFLRNGNVGIGTSTPSVQLEVSAPDSFLGGILRLNNNRTSLFDGDQNGSIQFSNNEATGGANGVRSSIVSLVRDTAGKTDMLFTTASNGASATEKMRITAAGNVGIGTASPSAKLDVSAGTNLNLGISQLTLNNFTNEGIGITLSRTTSDDDLSAIGTVDSDKLGILSREAIIFATGGGSTYSATSEIGRWTTNGLCFNGDTAAANALDDYEEGTWTPSVFFGTSSTGFVYAAQLGKYTKIGNSVTVEFGFTLTTKGSGTGPVKISGLPFTHASSYRSGMSIGNVANLTFVNQFFGFVEGNSTDIYLRETTNVGVTTDITNADFANNTTLYGTISYLV